MDKEQLNWYAVKVFYNKVFDMETLLHDHGLTTYLAAEKRRLKGPAHTAARRKLALLQEEHKTSPRYIQEGPFIYERVPMVSSLIFFQATESDLSALEKELKDPSGGSPKGFIYKTPDWKSYAVIPQRQMEIFRLVTDSGASGLDFFSPDDIALYKEGGKVRVTEGPLQGVEGYVKRIRKDRRLLVCLDGIIGVATSYIPMQFLEPVEE